MLQAQCLKYQIAEFLHPIWPLMSSLRGRPAVVCDPNGLIMYTPNGCTTLQQMAEGCCGAGNVTCRCRSAGPLRIGSIMCLCPATGPSCKLPPECTTKTAVVRRGGGVGEAADKQMRTVH